MRCIFCKKTSANSKSKEHIIPESLGNNSHILPSGIVCDSCNNYFSRKVEGPLLNSLYFRTLRSEEGIMSKRGRPAQVPSILAPGFYTMDLAISSDEKNDALDIVLPHEKDWDIMVRHNKEQTGVKFYIPKCPDEPPSGIMDRFLCKAAVEAFAMRLIQKPDSLEEFIDDEQLDAIRNYARYGQSYKSWLYHQRVIYSRDHLHLRLDAQPSQVLHEFDFLFTDEGEVYFILAIFGVEYTINMAGPSIEGYSLWLSNNDEKSPLYC